MVSEQAHTNQAVQAQKVARGWKLWIWKVEEMYCPIVKKKVLISFAVTEKLICSFVFAYIKCWFSHEAAHIMTILYALHWHNVKGNTLNNNNLSFLYKYAGKNNYNNLINNGYLGHNVRKCTFGQFFEQ